MEGFIHRNTAMMLILPVILLFLEFRSSEPRCIKETMNPKTFSIDVTDNIQMEYGECIRIPYGLRIPAYMVKIPYKRIWFRGDPQHTVHTEVVKDPDYETSSLFTVPNMPPGEYEYGVMMEWECNQTYVFPKRVHISITALNKTPYMNVPEMTEKQHETLMCSAPRTCQARARIYWKLTSAAGIELPLDIESRIYFGRRREMFDFFPSAFHHDLILTCVAEYEDNVVTERSVTLNVKFLPRIMDASHCGVKGKQLVCTCISWGNPLPSISWPGASLTDYTISSSSNSSNQIVTSTFSMSAKDNHNISFACISSNEIGQKAKDIPITNYTDSGPSTSEEKPSSSSALPWIITSVSICLNLVLLTSLIICFYKRGKGSQKKQREEMNVYSSLNRSQIDTEYSVISPQKR